MRRVRLDIGADHHMLVEPSVDRSPKSLRIVTSNWIFDALEDFGPEGIAKIVQSGVAVGAGMAPRAVRPHAAAFLSPEEKNALARHGHAEIYCHRFAAGGTSMFALFSAGAPRRIDAAALARAHMACSYALNQFMTTTGARLSPTALSERERECLLWVSEGKTTDEVALILGVSSHTVNSYISHAIQKFGASNRAMAIATAIRSGLI